MTIDDISASQWLEATVFALKGILGFMQILFLRWKSLIFYTKRAMLLNSFLF